MTKLKDELQNHANNHFRHPKSDAWEKCPEWYRKELIAAFIAGSTQGPVVKRLVKALEDITNLVHDHDGTEAYMIADKALKEVQEVRG